MQALFERPADRLEIESAPVKRRFRVRGLVLPRLETRNDDDGDPGSALFRLSRAASRSSPASIADDDLAE